MTRATSRHFSPARDCKKTPRLCASAGDCWAGWQTSHNPNTLARRIDEFRPDVIYTYGSVLALHPLFCRKLLCQHKAFKVVHGWDDHYGRIWGELFGWPGKMLMDWIEKRIVKNSDGVVTLSYELQKIGRTWGVDCHYIPNFVTLPNSLSKREKFITFLEHCQFDR